jgi:hypothetical protein
MDPMSVVLAPIRIPLRIASALDDLAAIAARARRDPDPVEVIIERLDAALQEISRLTHVAQRLEGGVQEVLAVGHSVVRTGLQLDSTGRDLHDGGEDLTAVAKALERDTRQLIDGGEELTAVSEKLEADLQVFRRALPRLLDGLDTVEELEGAVETVADTVEPLQATAERVGRVTNPLSRRRG